MKHGHSQTIAEQAKAIAAALAAHPEAVPESVIAQALLTLQFWESIEVSEPAIYLDARDQREEVFDHPQDQAQNHNDARRAYACS